MRRAAWPTGPVQTESVVGTWYVAVHGSAVGHERGREREREGDTSVGW